MGLKRESDKTWVLWKAIEGRPLIRKLRVAAEGCCWDVTVIVVVVVAAAVAVAVAVAVTVTVSKEGRTETMNVVILT